jgi:hypothetical protein
LWAAVQLPPPDVPLATWLSEAERALRSDPNLWWELAELLGCWYPEGGDPADTVVDRDAVADELAVLLAGLAEGRWSRHLGHLETYDAEGRAVVLTLAGEMSWGEVPEALRALWTAACLPLRWWEGEGS